MAVSDEGTPPVHLQTSTLIDNDDVIVHRLGPAEAPPPDATTVGVRPVPLVRRDTHPTINIAVYVATLLLVSGFILLSQTVGLDA